MGLEFAGGGGGFRVLGSRASRGAGPRAVGLQAAVELGLTITYQHLQNSRVPIKSILGFIIRTCKKVGFRV